MSTFTAVENGTEDKYYKKYNAILRRCSCIQKENEMLVNRVYEVKKIVRRLRRERKYLMEELDKRGDNYRSLPLTIAIEEEEDKPFALPQSSSLPALGRPRSSSSSTSGSRRQPAVKREKGEGGAAAVGATGVRKPSTAVMQFWQEQWTSTTTTHTLHHTGKPMDKKQLTKLLAARWNALADDDKKMYIEKYEKEKERHSGDRKHPEHRKTD